MSQDDPCQCARCRLMREFEDVAVGDFMAQAQLAGARSFPAFKRMVESLYAEEWKNSSVSPGAFLMLAGVLLLAAVWVFLLRYVPDRAILVNPDAPFHGVFPVRSNLLHVFAPRAASVLAFLQAAVIADLKMAEPAEQPAIIANAKTLTTGAQIQAYM